MKTKTIITAFLLLFSISSFAQTKEETISWLKEKISSNMEFLQMGHGARRDFQLLKIDECNIVYSYEFINNQGEVYSYEQTLPINKIDIEKTGEIIGNGKVFFTKDLTDKTQELREKASIKFMDIDNLPERVAKAINHLATFCAKQKETF